MTKVLRVVTVTPGDRQRNGHTAAWAAAAHAVALEYLRRLDTGLEEDVTYTLTLTASRPSKSVTGLTATVETS